MKKLLVLLFVSLLTTGLFAYDGTVYGGVDASFPRSAWLEQASSLQTARSIAVEELKKDNLKLTKFYQVTEANADDEDNQVLDDIEDFIDEEYGAKNRNGYSHLVIRSKSDDVVDGWIIFSHYTNKEGFAHFTFYFSATNK